jgi:hydrogenase/urease accessory protein HupE
MRRSHYIFLGIFALLLMQTPADAHLVTTGLGPVYDGIGHFSLAPDDSIPVFALALLAGLRGKSAGRSVMFQLPLAWLCGGVAGLMAHSEPAAPLQCISFMTVGVLIATDLPLPDLAVVGVALAVGFLHGFLNGAGFQAAGPGNGVLELLGISVMIFVLATVFAALVVSIHAYWGRIVVRVAGSWIAAIGLLMLGWALRPVH